ncbi:MAG: NADH-quinone oxidoreductase subunit C [Zetaproteobacteria bacterium]|nr:NADH-quinone oxidoreductase subunit C [Zetaproteobacteria bacterium]
MNVKNLDKLQTKFADDIVGVEDGLDCTVVGVKLGVIVDLCHFLKDQCGFEQLIDLCGVDWSTYRNVDASSPRFSVVYHLLSVANNERLRLKVAVNDRDLVGSVAEVWPTANWFEREAFDMYGLIFKNHPDLRRLLTDYGFEGYPLRKDFPLTGRVEMFFDEDQWRCVYRTNQVTERNLIPKTWPEEHHG